MGFPNFVLRLLAVALEFIGARHVAQRLLRIHLGLLTTVQKTLTTKLKADLLDLPLNSEEAADRLRRIICLAAREPLKIYVHTRNVAADITAGTLAALTGIVLFNQFTPGSISAGSTLAHIVAKEQAVSEFALGDLFGRWYYTVFPVSPSPTVIVVVFLVVMATIAVVGAFSGIIHDPIQTSTGIHRRRLNRLLDAIEASAKQSIGKGYRPKDMFFWQSLCGPGGLGQRDTLVLISEDLYACFKSAISSSRTSEKIHRLAAYKNPNRFARLFSASNACASCLCFDGPIDQKKPM